MGYALQLFFDGPLEAAVRRVWEELSRQSVTSTLLELDDHPHLSLGVFDDAVQLDVVQRVAYEMSRAVEPVPLQLSHVGSFNTDEGVVFLGVTPTQRLLGLHREVCRRLGDDGVFPIEYYRRNRWVPHVTVGQDVPSERMQAALSVCREVALPVSGEARGIEVVKFRPVESVTVHRFHSERG